MKPEVERCGEEAAPCNAIRLNRVKDRDADFRILCKRRFSMNRRRDFRIKYKTRHVIPDLGSLGSHLTTQ